MVTPSLAGGRHAFDYVIVGGGSAGCALAARLAEDADLTVALLEAGGPQRRILEVPLIGLWAWLRWPSRYCWQDWTVPQPALDNRRLFWPAGMCVGGSSSINAMVYNRGHRGSYDRWAGVAGPAWTYDALVPYFRRAEDRERGASPWHGVGGPIGVAESRYRSDLAHAFVAGCLEAGLPATDDFSVQPEGAGLSQLTQRAGRRSSATAYLDRTPGGPRVAVLTHARVTRLTFDGERVTGVEYTAGRSLVRIGARREVILCAGVVRTPQLLMLSGIGPADSLRRLGIDVVADSPSVGANLQDHVRVPVLRAFSGPNPASPLRLMLAGVEYALARRGLLTSSVCDAAAVLRLDADAGVPQVRIIPHWRATSDQRRTVVDFEVALVDPQSRGRLSLITRDPSAAMAIDPAYLSAPMDGAILTRGIELARTIAETPSCRSAGVGPEILPGSRDVWAHLRAHSATAYHVVGTCRLGSDTGAVATEPFSVDGWGFKLAA